MKHVLAASAPLLFAFGNMAAAQEPFHDTSAFRSFAWGIICAEDSGERIAAPDTMAGFIDIYAGKPHIGRATTRIPAIEGLAFGIVAQANGVDLSAVTARVNHPPMGTGGVTRQSWESFFSAAEPSSNFFRFDYPEERVPGPWTMEATVEGRVIYSVTFEVVDPSLMPDFVNPCPGPQTIS